MYSFSVVFVITLNFVAERQGFEPWDPARGQRFSRPPRSTTLASLLSMIFYSKEQSPTLCGRLTKAEREGFEPPEACTSTVFKTAAIDHSAISPRAKVLKNLKRQKILDASSLLPHILSP
jgi:hypothetical protein